MRRATPFSRMTLAGVCLVFLLSTGIDILRSTAQEQALSAEEKREQVAAERFLQLLLSRPTAGTALDRVFGYHVARGEIVEVIDELASQAEQATDQNEAGRHWMVVGLLQLQRSEDAAAAKALQQAESKLPQNALAAYYHGQALLLVGKTDAATEAMQRAIDLKPPRRDYLTIAGQLGRLYQRAGKADDAMRIWKQLEEGFPGDDGVRQRIARVLLEEGDTKGALERYEALSEDARSQNDRIVYSLRAADLRIRMGNKDEAIPALESLLSRLRPGSYLYDEARRRIETAFLSNGDYAGLAAYYQNWVTRHPDDIGAVIRLARTLSIQGRGTEAVSWFQQAIQRAPSDTAPRLALIDACIAEQRFSEAAKQYEALAEMEPNNPDHFVRWGQVLLEDHEQPKPARTRAAAEIWQRLAQSRSTDAAIQSQVADLMRGAQLVEQALDGYRAAIKLAPDQPQYKEYLGEFLHRLDRKDEAMKVWKSLVEGDLRTRENVVRLAEVLNQFDRPQQALETMAEACEMNPTIDDRLRYADWLADAEQYEAALQQITLAEQSTDTFDDRERVFAAEVRTYQASGQLADRIEQARTAAEQAASDGEQWRRLAVLYNANRQTPEALQAIEHAVKKSPQSIESLDIAARMYEEAGRLRLAAEKRRQLADSDQRFRGGHLQRLASLHLRMGQSQQAVAAGKEYLAASAGAIEAYQFYADLCGQIGQIDQRLDTLRRCVRMNPRSTEAQQMLAAQLAEDFKTDQAIELYWKMLDGADDIQQRRDVVQRLADLYLRTNRLDQLISRLEIRGRESGDRRTTIDLVSTAHQQAGDLGSARDALEGLLRDSGRDTLLIDRLVTLAEQAGEFDEAVRLQRQLVQLAPDRTNEARLASLLIDIGQMDEAQAMWLRLTESSRDPKQIAGNIDRLFAAGETKAAIELANSILEQSPDDWETRLRLMSLQADEGDWEAAARTADQLTSMNVKDTTLPVGGKPRQPTWTSGGRTYRTPPMQLVRFQSLYTFYQLVDDRYGSPPMSALPKPIDFGHAKQMALYCQLRHMHLSGGDLKGHVANLERRAMAEGASADQVWAWYEAASTAGRVRQTSVMSYPDPSDWKPLWRLAEVDRELGSFLLSQMFSNRSRSVQRGNVQLQRLSDEQLGWLKNHSESADTAQSGLIAYTPNVSWPELYGSELRIAGRKAEAESYLREQLDRAIENTEPTGLVSALQQASAHGTDDQLWPLIERALDHPEIIRQTYGTSLEIAMLQLFTSEARTDDGLSDGVEDPEYSRRVMQLADRVLEHEAAKPLRRRTIRLTSIGGPRNTYRISRGIYRRFPIEFPPKGLGPDDRFVQTLRGAWQQMKHRNVQWIEALQEEASQEVDPRLTVWRQIAAATLLQWEDRTADAIAQLDNATVVAGRDVPHLEPELRLMSADLLLRQDRKREALRAIDSLAVYDQNTMALREFAAARLAAAIGDRQRASSAAKRLFGVRLNTDAQIELAKLMRTLDMRELASDLVRRMRSRGGSSTDQLQSLMTYFVAQGEKDQAAEVAMELLRRSAPPRRFSSRYTTSNQARRRNALQTLATTGRLTSLIQATEARLENAPKSQRIRSELAEMYAAAGKTAKSQELLGKTDLAGVSSVRALQSTAQQLVSAGKMDQACDAYLKLLRRKQDNFSQDYYDIKRPFEQQKRLGDLADLMIEVGLAKFTDYRVADICEELIRSEENIAKARELYLAMLQLPSTTGNSMHAMSNIMGSARQLLTDRDLVRITTQYMIDASVGGTPWQTLFSGYSTGGDARHNNLTTYFVRFIAEDDENTKLVEQAIRQKLEEQQDWQEGRTWLGLLLTARKQFDEAKQLLEPLLAEETSPPPTHDTFWLVGSLIDTHPPMRGLAERMYAHALANTTDRTSRDFKSSLKGRVCRFMVEIGKKQRAREMALEAIENKEASASQSFGNAQYDAYREIRSTLGMIDFLAELEFPADALRLARDFDRSLFVKAGRYERGYTKRFDDKQQQLTEQVRELGGLATAGAMINANTDGPAAVDFAITLGDRPFTGPGLTSLWIDLVEQSGADDSQAEEFERFVDELRSLTERRRQDDSAAAAYAIAADVGGQRQSLRQLVDRWIDDSGSGTTATGPELRNRLLLVALLRLDRAASAADPAADRMRIAELDLESTGGMSAIDVTYFLAELGKQTLARRDEDTTERLWNRVVDLAAHQWLLIDASHAAVNAGMTGLSSAAFVAAVAAPSGQIIGQPDTQMPAGSLGQLLHTAQPKTTTSTTSRLDQLDPQEVRLARTLLELDDAWRAKKVDSSLVVPPLVALLMQGKGSQPRTLCIPVEVKNEDQLVTDSVFDRLARRAHEVQQADQLLTHLASETPGSGLLAGLVLLRAGRGEEARARYEAVAPAEMASLPKEMALQSLLVALNHSRCRLPAMRLALALVDQNRPSQRYASIEPYDAFSLKLASIALKHNMRQEFVSRSIANYIQLSEHDNDRYSSNSSRVTRRLGQLDKVAKMLLPKGRTEQALRYLAMRQSGFSQGFDRGNDWIGLWALESINAMSDRTAAYEMLADWTFQGDGPLQSITALARRQRLPDWIPESVSGPYPSFPPVADPSLPIATNFHFLATLAEQAGKADDLIGRFEQARGKDRTGSRTGLAIALAALEKPVGPQLLAEVAQRLDAIKPGEGKPKSAAPLAELQLASILVHDPIREDFARRVTQSMVPHTTAQSRDYLMPWVARFQHRRGWAKTSSWKSADELAHWMRSTMATSRGYWQGKTPPLWVTDGNGIDHVCGIGEDYLWLRYPLEGNFTFELETTDGNWSESELVCDGLRFTALGNTASAAVKSQESNDWARFYSEALNKNDWNHCSVTLDDESMSYRINGALIYREDRKNSAPWIGLHSEGMKRTSVRNIKITGQPVIPRRVNLIPESDLRGWSGKYYGQKLPSADVNIVKQQKDAREPRRYRTGPRPDRIKDLAWTVKDGELVSGKSDKRGFGGQSCIRYERPLGDGETIAYEFLYEEGKTEVHPSIGRVAYLFRPDGLHLHWMSTGYTSWKTPADYEVLLPGSKPSPLALKSNDWNQVRLTRKGNVVEISLNGTTVFDEQPQSRLGDMVFGLFHNANQTSARVRNATLTGPWPEQLPNKLLEF